MLAHLRQHPEAVVTFLILAFLVLRTVVVLQRAKRNAEEGVEADAVVSAVSGGDDGSEPSVCVSYRDEDGTERQSPLAADPEIVYQIGDRVRIRFFPGRYDLVHPAAAEPRG